MFLHTWAACAFSLMSPSGPALVNLFYWSSWEIKGNYAETVL